MCVCVVEETCSLEQTNFHKSLCRLGGSPAKSAWEKRGRAFPLPKSSDIGASSFVQSIDAVGAGFHVQLQLLINHAAFACWFSAGNEKWNDPHKPSLVVSFQGIPFGSFPTPRLGK